MAGDPPSAAQPRETPSVGPARLRRPSLVASLAAAAIGVGLLVHLRAWTFACDDAFISFRYARNLGQHGALVYNLEPAARVEGYTNLLWVLALGLGDAIGLAPDRLAPVLTAVAALVSLLLVALIAAALRRRFGPPASTRTPAAAFELVDLAAPLLLALTPEFVVWASSGLETSAALALALAAVFAWLRGRIEAAALLAALAGLTRLDALVAIAAFGLAWLGLVAWTTRAGPRPPIPWRRVAVASLIFAAPLLAQLGFRRAYYGAWLPNTWAVKHHGALLRASFGVAYLRWWLVQVAVWWAAPLLALARPRHLILAVPIATQLAWVWSVGGDFMAYSRFLLPATALLALLVGLALAEGRAQALARWPAKRRWIDAAWLLGALAVLIPTGLRIPDRLALDRAHAHLHLDDEPVADGGARAPGFEGVTGMREFAAVRVAAGQAFAERLPPTTVVTVGAAGAMPYAAGFETYDAYGLVDRSVVAQTEPRGDAGARPGHQLHASLTTMLAHEPDLLCHLGYAGTRKPPRSLARRMGAPRAWAQWACVETGPIPDRHAEGGALASHYYCCLRPRDRFAELDPQRDPQREPGGAR